MEAKGGKRGIDTIDRGLAKECGPEVEIGGVFAAARDFSTDFFPEFSAPKDGFLLDEIRVCGASVESAKEVPSCESRHFLQAFEGAIFKNADFFQRGNPLDFRESLKNFSHGGKGPREVEI